jgi:hypothetical protein
MTGNENTNFTLTASQRRLKAIVIVLGVLIVLAFGALVVGFLVKLGQGKAAVNALAAPASTPFQSSVALAPRQSVVSTELKNNRLLVHLKGPNGEDVVIVDAATGRELGRVHLTPQP